MGELYRHIDPQLTREQEEIYLRIARHLILATCSPNWNPLWFEIGRTAYDLETGDDLAPDQVVARAGLVMADLLGWGPLAGIPPLAGEDWRSYQYRVLGAEQDSPLEDWLLSSQWLGTDNTPVGAAMRMMYVLDYGVPGDWLDIIDGRKDSDYLRNSFLWDRVGLPPPGYA